MRKLYDVVESKLRNHPEMRDSDKKLIWSIWMGQGLLFYDFKIKQLVISESSFLEAMTPESITRARRKVQENNPELASSPNVQAVKDEKESKKGNFVYQRELI